MKIDNDLKEYCLEKQLPFYWLLPHDKETIIKSFNYQAWLLKRRWGDFEEELFKPYERFFKNFLDR